MSMLSDFMGLAFTIVSFNFLVTIITSSPTYCLIAIFIEVVIALAYSVYLLQKMSSAPSRTARYSKCYTGQVEKVEANVDHQVKGRELTWEEKEIMRELETKEKYIFA